MNPYQVQMADFTPAMEGISRIGNEYREGNRRKEFAQRVSKALETGDAQELEAIRAEFPNLGKGIEQMIGFRNDKTKSIYGSTLANALDSLERNRMEAVDETGTVMADDQGNPVYDYSDDMETLGQVEQAIAEVEKLGGNPKHLASIRQNIQEGDYDEALRSARTALAFTHPDEYEARYGTATTKQNEVKYGAGRTIVKDKEGNQWYSTEVRDPINNTIETKYSPIGDHGIPEPKGEIEIVGAYGETAPERMARDTRTASEKRRDARNQKNAQDASDTYETIMSNAGLYDEAIQAIDEGASTSWWTKNFPTLRASTAKLDRVRNQLALNQLSLVSMGALSEKELDVLQQTAIPTMSAEKQKEWLKMRRDATIKYAEFLQEAALAYDAGESKAEFVKRKKEEASFKKQQKKRNETYSQRLERLTGKKPAGQ